MNKKTNKQTKKINKRATKQTNEIPNPINLGCPRDLAPLDIQLVLDSSNSMGIHWTEMIEELQENFIDVIMTNNQSRMGITRFGQTHEELV